MPLKKVSLNIETSTEFFTIPVYTQAITGEPTTRSPYIMLNCINWQSLNNLPLQEASEFTYFVLPVAENGVLSGVNIPQETKFVADVRAAGKKATFSVAGGAQNVSAITKAVTINKTAFIQNIKNHLIEFGYDGVTLDIENTALSAPVLPAFIKELRAALDLIRPNLIIGCYTQPYQLNTVHANLQEANREVTWISAMIYDFPNTVEDLKRLTLEWLPKVGNNKSKLLVGVAVNYDASGLDIAEFPFVLDWITAQGLGGIGIWQNTIYTEPYAMIRKQKWPVIV